MRSAASGPLTPAYLTRGGSEDEGLQPRAIIRPLDGLQRKVSRRRRTRSNLLSDGFGRIVSACGSVLHSSRRSRVRSAAPYLSGAAVDPWDGIGRRREETVSGAGPTQRAFAR